MSVIRNIQVKKNTGGWGYAFILLFLLYTQSITGQNWQEIAGMPPFGCDYRTLYADSIDNYLYVGGQFGSINGLQTNNIARWDGVQWDSLGSGTDYVAYHIGVICRYQGEIVAGGRFNAIGGINSPRIARWNGVQWDSLLVQGFKSNVVSVIATMQTINNKLWVGGTFDTVAGQPCKKLAIWNGTEWEPLGLPPAVYYSASVNTICEYQGEVYIGGNFGSNLPVNEDTIKAIIKWDGTNWKSVGGGMRGTWSLVSDMVVYNNELYVAGNFFKADGNVGQEIQKWDGIQWKEVGGSLMGYNQATSGTVFDMLVYNNKLYVVGQMEYAGGVPASKIAIWDGNQWCGLGSTFDGIGNAVGFFNDTLYMTGGFWTIDGDSIYRIAKWLGGDYVEVCGTVGIDEEEYLLEFEVYPNPASEVINISIPENLHANSIKYNLYNSLGQKLAAGIIVENNTIIDIGFLNDGIYYLEIIAGNKRISRKLLKIR